MPWEHSLKSATRNWPARWMRPKLESSCRIAGKTQKSNHGGPPMTDVHAAQPWRKISEPVAWGVSDVTNGANEHRQFGPAVIAPSRGDGGPMPDDGGHHGR
jgi:hypothetical protein